MRSWLVVYRGIPLLVECPSPVARADDRTTQVPATSRGLRRLGSEGVPVRFGAGIFLSRRGNERALRDDKSFHRGIGCTHCRLMHSHCRKGQSLCGIVSSHRRVIFSHHREIHSLLLRDSSLCRKETCSFDDGPTFCCDCYSFHCEVTFFRRIESVNRRIVHVHLHDERVHSVIVLSPRGIGRTQCRKESSREQSGSYYPRIGSVIHRKLCINCRLESAPCGKRRAKSSVVRALRRWADVASTPKRAEAGRCRRRTVPRSWQNRLENLA